MPYLSPAILEALGLRQRPEGEAEEWLSSLHFIQQPLMDEEEPIYESPMDVYRQGERAPVSPYAGITPTPTSPVAPEPNPYRQVGSMLWTGEEPSTTEPSRMIPTVTSLPITEGPSGERTLRAPEGTATWRAGPQGFPAPGRINDPADVARINARLQETADLQAANAAAAQEREKRAQAARDAPRQNLIAEILSMSRANWGRTGERARAARVGELLTILKALYGTSALGGLLGVGEGGGAGPGGLVPTGVTVDEKGGIKRTFGPPPPTRIGGGPASRSYEDYVREAETKGLTGADRTRYAEKEMRRAAEEAAFAKSQQGVLGGATGPAAEAKVTLAGRIAERTTREREQAKLDYLRLPADAGNRYALYKQVERDVNRIEDLFQPWMVGKGFQAAQGFAPLKQAFEQFEKQASVGQYQSGALFGAIREWTGSATGEEVEFRQAISDAANTILYARSGAQINEDEFQRLKGALFSLWDEPTVFLTRLHAVRNIVGGNITSILEAAGKPVKEIQAERGAGGAAVGGGALPRPNAGEEVRRDRRTGKSWVRRNGQMIEVQP